MLGGNSGMWRESEEEAGSAAPDTVLRHCAMEKTCSCAVPDRGETSTGEKIRPASERDRSRGETIGTVSDRVRFR